MTAFEEIVYEQAKRLTALSGGETTQDELCQRFSVNMIQCRAQECRHLATQLMMKALDPTSGLSSPQMAPAAASFARTLTERSHHLEALAMEWAKTWPPEDKDAQGKVGIVQ